MMSRGFLHLYCHCQPGCDHQFQLMGRDDGGVVVVQLDAAGVVLHTHIATLRARELRELSDYIGRPS